MTYRIARNGQLYGPYSLMEFERFYASGHILPSDLAQPAGGDEWLPVATLFPTAPTHAPRALPGGLPALFPDPPNLSWWIALLLGIVTGLAFFVVWDIIEAAWMRRVERSSIALPLYIGVAVLYIMKLPANLHSIVHDLGFGPPVDAPYAAPLFVIGLILLIVARFVFRNELLHHFNGPEPIGLRLNAFFTLILGGLYFQYHFNRINDLKHTLRISVPAA